MKQPAPPSSEARGAAEAAALRCLELRDFAGAVRAVAAYEARQPVPRGINMDWANPRVDSEVAALRSIFAAEGDASEQIRTAAALMYLWGVSKPYRRWLPREADGDRIATRLAIDAHRACQDFSWDEAYRKFGTKRPTR